MFKACGELIGVLFAIENNNKLLMKNHEQRPTSSRSNPEANANVSRSIRERQRGLERRLRRGS